MMTLAFLGASLNLFVIWKVRSLRSKPRRSVAPATSDEEKLFRTLPNRSLNPALLLLAAEWITHPLVHRVP